MQNVISHARFHWLGYSVIFIGMCIQMYLVSQPLSFLLVHILPDDAFYYFQIARNVAQGIGSTFDGIHSTNGYHPLWLLVLTVMYASTDILNISSEAVVRIALIFSVILNTFTAIMLYELLGRYVKNPRIQALALSVWVLNPYVLYEMMNGLETSLATFFLVLFMVLVVASSKKLSQHRLICVGCVAGLMILARVDLVFYFIAFLLWILLTRGVGQGLGKVLVAGFSASALVIPWLLWNKIGFGMWLTSAAEGNAFVNQVLTHQSGVGGLYEIKHVIYHLSHFSSLLLDTTGLSILFLIFVGVLWGMFLHKAIVLHPRLKTIPIEVALLCGFCLLFFADAGIRFTGRSWYFISFNIFVALLFVVVVPYIEQRTTHFKKLFLFLLILCMVGSFSISWHRDLQDRMPNQLVIYTATLWSNANLPEGSILGAFNGGIAGYYSIHPVVNLDGLVNNSALEALEARTLWNYASQEGITHFIESEYYFTHRYDTFLGVSNPLGDLTVIKNFPIPGDTKSGSVSVFQLP